MQTAGAINQAPKTGDIVTIWGNEYAGNTLELGGGIQDVPTNSDFQMTDPADGSTGNIFYTGTWWNADGTNGALFFINLVTVTLGNEIIQVEVQGLFGQAYVTVITFTGLTLNAPGTYIFQVQPGAASAGNYVGTSQDAVPNMGRLKVTMTNNSEKISGTTGMQTTW